MMTAPPDHDEIATGARLRARIDGPPGPSRPRTAAVPPPPRPRDWLDDIWDETPAPAVPPPAPPARPAVPATGTPDPSWDWRRLLHWPYARLFCGAAVALIPWFNGYSASTGWGAALRNCRTEASPWAAWIVAAIALTAAAITVHQRRWYGWILLTSTFIGLIYMASPFDIVTFFTGVTR